MATQWERAWQWLWSRRKRPRSAPSSACISSAPNAKRASSRPRHTTLSARRCARDSSSAGCRLTMANSAIWPSASGPPGRTTQASNVKATREDWLDLALSTLAVEGVDHVTVLSFSERLGVSRSSFYWYFKNRDELL